MKSSGSPTVITAKGLENQERASQSLGAVEGVLQAKVILGTSGAGHPIEDIRTVGPFSGLVRPSDSGRGNG